MRTNIAHVRYRSAATEGRPMWAVVDEALKLYLDTIEIVEQGQAQDAR